MRLFYHGIVLYSIWRMLGSLHAAVTGQNAVAVVLGMFFALPWAVAASLILVRLYLPGYCEWLGRCVYLPVRRFKRPVAIHSRAEGLLERGEYAAAEVELKRLLYRDALDVAANHLMVELLLAENRGAEAALFLEEYLNHPGRELSEDTARMVLRYADLRGGDARELLMREAARNYPGPARRMLRQRLAVEN